MSIRALVLSAAYPGPTEPERAIFLEGLHSRLVEAHGFEIDVLAPRTHRDDPLHEERAGVSVRRFRFPSGGKRLKERDRVPWWRLGIYLVSALAAGLRSVLRSRHRVVLCHWVLPLGIAARVLARVAGVPYVVVAHGSDLNRYARRSRLARWVARRALAKARTLVAVSGELADFARDELGFDPTRIEVVPLGPDPIFSPGEASVARASLGLEPDAIHLLFVGDVSLEKGVGDLLESLGAWREGADAAPARTAREPREVIVHLVGSPVGWAGLERAFARAAERVRVERHGRVEPARLVDWYRAADALVFPSWSEGAPLVVMEAISCGLPVIATRVGAIPGWIEDGVDGRLVPPRDPARLAGVLAEILEEPERLSRYREARRRRAAPPDRLARSAEYARILNDAAGLADGAPQELVGRRT